MCAQLQLLVLSYLEPRLCAASSIGVSSTTLFRCTFHSFSSRCLVAIKSDAKHLSPTFVRPLHAPGNLNSSKTARIFSALIPTQSRVSSTISYVPDMSGAPNSFRNRFATSRLYLFVWLLII